MTLTIHMSDTIYRIELSVDEFQQLRHSQMSQEDIVQVAARTAIPSEVLIEYMSTFNLPSSGEPEAEYACDYSDHTL